MSFKATIVDQLKIRLLNKNILIIKGNTSDFVIPKILDLNIKKPPKEDDINNKLSKQTYLDSLIDFESKDILTFNQYLMHFLYQDPNFRFNRSSFITQIDKKMLMLFMVILELKKSNKIRLMNLKLMMCMNNQVYHYQTLM